MIDMNDLIKQANDLRAKADLLEAQAIEQKQVARNAILVQIKATIIEHNFTIAELGLKFDKHNKPFKTENRHPSAGKKIEIKYKDDFGNVWTGRGVKPRWLNDAINNGASLEQFLIVPPMSQ